MGFDVQWNSYGKLPITVQMLPLVLSQQIRPRMILEQVGRAHITGQHVGGAMAADFRHLEDRGPGFGGAGHEPGPKAMGGEVGGVEAHLTGIVFHPIGHAFVGQGRLPDPAALPHRPEHRPRLDAGHGQPALQRRHRAEQHAAVGDSDHLPRPFRVGLGFANRHPQAIGHERQVIHRQRHQFGAAERPGEAQEQQRPVALTGQRVGTAAHHFLDDIGGGGFFLGRGRALRPADAFQGGRHALVRGRRRQAFGFVGELDGGEPPGQGRGGDIGLGLIGQEQGHRFRGRRQRGQRVSRAPGAKDSDIAGVGFAGGEAQALVDVIFRGFGQNALCQGGVWVRNQGGHVGRFLVPGMFVIGTKSITEKALLLREASVSWRKNLTVKLLEALRYRFKKSPHQGL
jgi:hypothetical protein